MARLYEPLAVAAGSDRPPARFGVGRREDRGADAVTIGRAAILHHDFPKRCRRDPEFEPEALPVSEDDLRSEGLSDAFIGYMRNWKGFVAD